MEYNTGLLVIEGEININGSRNATADNFVYFSHDGEKFTVEAVTDSIVLLLSGEPVNEEIYPYGPFVMNTRDEIKQAYEDFYNGKFGHLED